MADMEDVAGSPVDAGGGAAATDLTEGVDGRAIADAGITEADRERLSRPREEMNGAERAYLEAREHLLSGRRPANPENLAAWRKGRLRINPTTVAREAGFDRGPIAGHGKAYGHVFRLLLGDADVVIGASDEPPELGPKSFERSLQQLRSRNVEKDRRIQVLQEKAGRWDAMVAAAAAAGAGGSGRRGRRRAAASADAVGTTG